MLQQIGRFGTERTLGFLLSKGTFAKDDREMSLSKFSDLTVTQIIVDAFVPVEPLKPFSGPYAERQIFFLVF